MLMVIVIVVLIVTVIVLVLDGPCRLRLAIRFRWRLGAESRGLNPERQLWISAGSVHQLSIVAGTGCWQPDACDQAAAVAVAKRDLHLVGDGELAGNGEAEAGAAGVAVA